MINKGLRKNIIKKASIACFCAFFLMICLMLLTSMNFILVSLAVLFHLSGMALLFLSRDRSRNRFLGFSKQSKGRGDWGWQYLKNPLDPTNPFYRSRHRL